MREKLPSADALLMKTLLQPSKTQVAMGVINDSKKKIKSEKEKKKFMEKLNSNPGTCFKSKVTQFTTQCLDAHVTVHECNEYL